jgi:adiponectin receptor
MFVAMGLSAVFPVLYGIELYGIENMLQKMGLYWVVLQGFLYILGAAIYAVSFFF